MEFNYCVHCRYPHKHRIIFDKIDKFHVLEIKDKCKICVKAFRRKKWLEEQILENEWELFGLQNHRQYFDP